MWQEQPSDRPWLQLQVMRHSELVYGFNAIGPNGLICSDVRTHLPPQEHNSVLRTLKELTDPRQRDLPVELFRKLGFLLYKLVLPETLRQLITQYDGPLIFVTDELSLPWELLHDGQEYLSLTRPVCRQPNMNDVMEDLGVTPGRVRPSQPDDPVLIIADTKGNLPSAAEEAEEVRALLRTRGIPCETLIGPKECTFVGTLGRLSQRSYQMIHYSGHAQEVAIKDAMTGAIELVDDLLMADSIRKVLMGEPVVFLNACYSHPVGASGERRDQPQSAGAEIVRSLTQAFALGSNQGRAKAMIGSMWWTEDEVARGMASRFYRGVFDGLTLGEALRRARQEVEHAGYNPVFWSTYVLFGKPHLVWQTSPALQDGTSTTAAAATVVASTPIECATRPKKVVGIGAPVDRADTTKPIKSHAGSEPPATAPPTTSAANLGSADELPWSDDVRVALLGSMATVSKMRWSVFSTMHVLLGLTYLDQGYLTRAFRKRNLDPDVTRRRLREKLAREELDANAKFVVSPNVKTIFLEARRLARERGHAEVSERHLIAALLATPDSSALRLLKLFDVDLQALQESLGMTLGGAAIRSGSFGPPPGSLNSAAEYWLQSGPTAADAPSPDSSIAVPASNWHTEAPLVASDVSMPASNDSSIGIARARDVVTAGGALDRRLFDDASWQALESAAILAWKTNWPEIRSPHVFLGMLTRDDSWVAGQLRQHTEVSPTQLAQLLVQGFTGPIDLVRPPPPLHRDCLSENVLRILQGGLQLAVQRGRSQIGETELLETMLADRANIVTQSFARIGITARQLLSTTAERGGAVLLVMVLRRAGGPFWLAQWRSQAAEFQPPALMPLVNEGVHQCLRRALATQFNLREGLDCTLPEQSAAEISLRRGDGGSDLRGNVFVLEIDSPDAVRLLDTDPDNRWLSAGEIEHGTTTDGHRVSPAFRTILVALGT